MVVLLLDLVWLYIGLILLCMCKELGYLYRGSSIYRVDIHSICVLCVYAFERRDMERDRQHTTKKNLIAKWVMII